MSAAVLGFLLKYVAGPVVGGVVGYWARAVLAAKVVAELQSKLAALEAKLK